MKWGKKFHRRNENVCYMKPHNLYVYVLVRLFTSVFGWRFWKFTLSPLHEIFWLFIHIYELYIVEVPNINIYILYKKFLVKNYVIPYLLLYTIYIFISKYFNGLCLHIFPNGYRYTHFVIAISSSYTQSSWCMTF